MVGHKIVAKPSLAHSGARGTLTAFWGEQRATVAIVAVARIFSRHSGIARAALVDTLAGMSSKEKGDSGTKPELRKAVRVWLEDGSRTHGMWTGTAWWSVKGEISPVKWELEERPKKTKKIAEKLPDFGQSANS